MRHSPTLWLASRSPRRRQLLTDAGIEVKVMPSEIDDGVLIKPTSLSIQSWVLVLAFVKARQTLKQLVAADELAGNDVVIGADTLCIVDNESVGQPRDRVDARRMLSKMLGRSHRTMTGVCLLTASPLRGELIFDAATVTVGDISDIKIHRYLDSGEWRGKAGAYNLAERLDDGWPIECEGDPTTVMGLPMQTLVPRARLHSSSSHAASSSVNAE